MINIIPASAFGDIASTTTAALSSFAIPAVIIFAILLSFFVIEFIVGILSDRKLNQR